MSEVAAEWLGLNKQRWSDTTHERYAQIVRDFINPRLGFLTLSRITRAKVREVLTETAKIRAAKTVELAHAVISGIFTEAIDLGYTNENPATGLLRKILPPKRKRNQTRPDPFSMADRDLMLEAARKHLPGSYALILETLAFTGMRLGECLAMRRDHLDLANNQYFVCESIRRDKLGPPKNGTRLIDVPEFMTKRLAAHVTAMRKEALEKGGYVAFLFPGIQQNAVRLVLKRACPAVPPLTLLNKKSRLQLQAGQFTNLAVFY
ncbi:MAG: site-specific integrase [Desulfobacteraceae bacterium]|nr:site-specific integrase [Desulfobacteraceae bacterium]